MTNRAQDRAWEAMATHEELRAHYKEALRLRMMRRRFRVEGTRAGNSYLLTKTSAIETRARHGGKIAEVIPFTSLPERQAATLPACPRCKVEKGKPCVSSSKKVRAPHQARWELDA